jgi:hypothetical protein
MDDYSLLEKANVVRQERDAGISFGRISEVFPDKRLCKVKTFMGKGNQNDNSLLCQWINIDAHPSGDESTCIPRKNSYGLVFFVAGEPFIFGFFSPLTGTGSASIDTKSKEVLNEGDRILKTVGGNKIIWRAHGEIEIQSTDTCKTVYFPDQSIINSLCRRYEFRTDGGTIDWISDDLTKTTLCVTEYRDTILRTNVIIEEKGNVDTTTISRTTIGPVIGGDIAIPVWKQTISKLGETKLDIGLGWNLVVKPTGATTLEVGKGLSTIGIQPTGETKIEVGKGLATITISPSGSIKIESKSDVSVDAVSGIKVSTKGKAAIDAMGGVEVSTKGNAKFDVLGNFTVESKGKGSFKGTMLEFDGGTGATEQLLTTPSAISDFTGLPIQMGSMTIKASK